MQTPNWQFVVDFSFCLLREMNIAFIVLFKVVFIAVT